MRPTTLKSLGVIVLATVAAGLQAQVAVNFTVDVNRNRKPINPLIYGTAYGTASQLSDLNAPLNRMGGNPTTRYNYQQNVDNRGADWYFESIPYASATPNAQVHTFVQNSKNGGAQPMLTIPMIDWIAKVGPNRTKLASFAVSKYGAQQYTDPGWPNAGNGVKPNGQFVIGNDKTDANTPNSTTFQRGWMDNLIGRWGTAGNGGVRYSAGNGGVRYYFLDNESSIWHYSHRDVQPEGLKMRDARQKMIDYATMVKARDPQAIVLGPEEWGWSGFFYSGFDQQAGQDSTSRRVRTTAGRSIPTAPRTATSTMRRISSGKCGSRANKSDVGCWTTSASTTTRRAASSPMTCRPRCSCAAIARPEPCGMRATPTNPGSRTRSS